MRLRLALLGVFVAAAALSGQSPNQSQFVGKWNITGTDNPRYILFLDVKENNGQLEAKFLDRSAHATPVPWIKVENGELLWQKGTASDTLPKPSCGPTYRAKLEGGKLVGSSTEPGDPCPPQGRRAGGGGAAAAGEGRGAGAGQAAAAAPAANPAPAAAPAPPKAPPTPRVTNWVGVKAPVFPPANANGTHTYGTPVVLVGAGAAADAWTGNTPETWQAQCVNRWTTTNGVWGNEVGTGSERPTCNVYSKAKFKDFKVEAELNLDAGQNSGFYIRGRHELQLSLGLNANSTYPGQLMDIYGWKRADPPPVANAAGEWQKLEAIVVGDRITVLFNDKKVHDNAQLYAWTGGALDANVDQPGPIMIQGDHSRVKFRKLVITPITKAGM